MVNATLAATGASYHNPQGTAHVVVGMAGDGFCCGGWTDSPPSWSAFREDSFGYSRVHVESDSELRLEYVRNGDAGDGVRDSFTITKSSNASSSAWQEGAHGEHALPQPRSHLGHRAHHGSCPENSPRAIPKPQPQTPPGSPRSRFNHSWDTMPVFWFSANTTGPENEQMASLIAKYPVAILAWQMGTDEAPVFRHGEDKLHAQAAALAVSAPSTEVRSTLLREVPLFAGPQPQ